MENLEGRLINITSILCKFKSLIKKVYQIGYTHKIKKKKDQKNSRVEISKRQENILTLKHKKQIDF